MVTQIRHKLLNIPVSLVNFVNSKSYDTSDLHQYHSIDKGEVGHKNYCKKCFKDVPSHEIVKGTSPEQILSKEQQERLKEQLDNQTIEILSFELDKEIPLTLIQKSQLILPSTSKGYKHKDIEIFFSFREAIKELNVLCKVKYITRGKEHYGIIKIHSNDLIFIELPFFSRLNIDDINRLKQAVTDLRAEPRLKDFAVDYIKSNLKEVDYQAITEKKAILIKQYLEQAITGESQEVEQEVNNPFLTK